LYHEELEVALTHLDERLPGLIPLTRRAPGAPRELGHLGLAERGECDCVQVVLGHGRTSRGAPSPPALSRKCPRRRRRKGLTDALRASHEKGRAIDGERTQDPC